MEIKKIRLEKNKKYQFHFMLCIILILQSVNVFSQIEHFTVSFESYAETHLQEKIFVHTDKENYVSGEIIWFKLFVTDALLNKPSNLCKI